ncbi:MAG: LysR family transcriptional regulator [Oscillospiraceae bacterium]|nr:LysR family transcriptional regulator [Oscillospiraceae bacterium]
MTTQQLTYVLTVAECRSISKAAEKLYVTQPSLSQYIHTIEKQLGVQLFDRSVTPLCLTDAGRLYADWARKLLAMEENMNNALADLMGLESGSVRIGASSFRVRCLLARSIAAFHAKYPNIHLIIQEAEMKQLRDMLMAGEIDFAIGSGEFDAKQFHVETLADERLYLAAAPMNPLTGRLPVPLTASDITGASLRFLRQQPIDLSLVAEEQFVAANAGEYDRGSLNAVCRVCGFTPQIAYSVRTIETVFSFVCANMGIALLPDSLIYYGNFRTHPNYYPLPEEIAVSPISLISRKNAYLPKAASAYALLLRQLVDVGTWRMGQSMQRPGGLTPEPD